MYCTKELNEWCPFGGDGVAWQCDDDFLDETCQTMITDEPTPSPTNPTYNPSLSPTNPPSPAPTPGPTRSPSPSPTFSPSPAPSDSPTPAPSNSPSPAPSAPPTRTPTQAPSRSPSSSPALAPSASPLALAEIVVDIEEGQQLERGTDYTLYFMLFGGFMTVAISFAVMRRKQKKESKMAVDDQKYLSVIMYLLQIIDMMTDLAFALQCRVYWLYGENTHLVADEQEDAFRWLYHLALTFIVGPYLMNIGSSVNITRQIDKNPVISSYSKRYFREKSKLYTLLVLLSGGSFAALKLMRFVRVNQLS